MVGKAGKSKRQETAVASAVACCAASVLLALAASAGPIEDRFVYIGCQLGNGASVDKAVDVAQRAGKLGFNGLVVQGDIQYAWLHGDRERANLERLKAACDKAGLEIIPAIWSVGYGTMLWVNPNLAAGIPVLKSPYEVSADGKSAVFTPSGDRLVSNGDFEEIETAADGARFAAPGWSLDEPGKIAFVDTEVKYSGRQSIRFDLSESGRRKDPQARAWCSVKVRPNSRYKICAKLKTEDLGTTDGFQIIVLAKPGEGEIEGRTRTLTVNRPRLKHGTTDWIDMTAEISTLDYAEIDIFMGSWHSRSGRFWLDDVNMVEVGADKLLRRPGCPVVVRDAATGEKYEEGRDFCAIPPLKKGQEKLERVNGAIALRIPEGSRIKPGAKLELSGFAMHRMKSDSQVSVCMSEPELYELLEKSAASVEAALRPRKWFLPLDEIRSGGTCMACRARKTDMAHIFGDCVTKMCGIIKRVSPGATIYMWGDQIDPKANAREQVHLCRGSFVGGADLVPKDLVIMHWLGAAPQEALAFFRSKGFRTARSRSIDGDWAERLAQTRADYRAAQADPGCRGFMYTTWRGDYSQEKLEAFSELWNGRRDDVR